MALQPGGYRHQKGRALEGQHRLAGGHPIGWSTAAHLAVGAYRLRAVELVDVHHFVAIEHRQMHRLAELGQQRRWSRPSARWQRGIAHGRGDGLDLQVLGLLPRDRLRRQLGNVEVVGFPLRVTVPSSWSAMTWG